MFIKGLMVLLLLQPTVPIKVIYSYDRTQHDSLEIIVNKNEKTIHHKNYRLIYNMVDSTPIIQYAKKEDNIEVVLRAYKKHLYCFPYIDKLTYPYYRISYGLNFECVRLKT